MTVMLPRTIVKLELEIRLKLKVPAMVVVLAVAVVMSTIMVWPARMITLLQDVGTNSGLHEEGRLQNEGPAPTLKRAEQ
jgi:hypothetical protein